MRRLALGVLTTTVIGAAIGAASCGTGGTGGAGGGGGDPPALTAEELRDPQACATCHPDHHREWSGSMHAYAAEDPVFLAMNARGQRETNGALGAFCVNCHAPMAVRSGATKDGLNLADLPASQKGVTCFFCHSVDAVTGTHDAALTLAGDGVLRGGIQDPVHTTAHQAAYSPLLDRGSPESATLCGSCHDIVSPLGAHLERTFEEWKGTLFSHGSTELTCGNCHMAGRDGLAAQANGVKLRRVHAHTFPGVDTALTAFPEAEAQREAVQQALDFTLQAEICVKGLPGNATIQVILDNVGAGHLWPSGATQDRRAWVEVVASAAGQVVYQSGVVPEGTAITTLNDPDLWLIRDCIFDGQGKQVHMFWEAASVDSNQLPGPTTNVPTDPAFFLTHVIRKYPLATSVPPTIATFPDKVTMRMRLEPIGLDVLDDLIASGDLDASVREKMRVLTLAGTVLEWTKEAAAGIQFIEQGLPVSCVSGGLTTGTTNPAPEHAKCP